MLGPISNHFELKVSPSLKFIKSHFEIPKKVYSFNVPVVAELDSGLKISGSIRVKSDDGKLSLHNIPIQMRVSKKVFDDYEVSRKVFYYLLIR